MFDVFYNESLRKTVVAFGSLFDEIFVQRSDPMETPLKNFSSNHLLTQRKI